MMKEVGIDGAKEMQMICHTWKAVGCITNHHVIAHVFDA